MSEKFSARGKRLDEILEAVENGDFAASYAGTSTLALEAAVAAAAARAQIRLTTLATFAALGSFFASVAAVVIAATH